MGTIMEPLTIDTDDPYGSVIVALRTVLRRGLEMGGAMNQVEHDNLITIEQYISAIDWKPPTV